MKMFRGSAAVQCGKALPYRKGPKTRAGFVASTTINRLDFGVSWNDRMDKGSIVVSDTVEITIDAEAILEGSESWWRVAPLQRWIVFEDTASNTSTSVGKER